VRARTSTERRQEPLHELLDGFANLVAERVSDRVAEALKAQRESSSSAKKPDFLSERELADRTGISRRSLQGWRQKGRGPRWVKLGGRVLYDASAIDNLK